ncbi:efflux transporter outer membrane subunit [Sphingomonas sp. BN140010]|uniref:Efflux transporter outer membrane subunit n=1 Tax=Sphingomonas arvum TaxID=2992113 RepID=A0ABT3JFI8_9SPHN|nr:efflux transporter outer membrane subunit [Sphingomonas sp. BN140010]MCW3797576.1 efflux transporter outer membrane subunit [Sphingomonas sp. BN140010]
MKRAVLLLTAAALAGCTSLDPTYLRPAAPVPLSWPTGDPYLAEAPALPNFTHRDVFRDIRLQTLIAQALVNNRDLRIAAANIAAAREQVRIARAAQLPQVGSSATLDANPRRNPFGGINGVRLSPAINVLPSFELDLFGRLASLTRAEQERLFATGAAERATRVALIGDIADAWLAHAADTSLLAIAEDTVRSAERSRALTEARLRGGVAPRTDLLQAQQVLETARADLAEQRALRAQDANLLQLLVGAPVDSSLLPTSLDQAAGTVAALPAGLDSRILLRRPDVIQSEFELRATNAEIGAARAALFPTISLTGLLGLASDTLTGLFSGGAFNFSAGVRADYSIFSGGARRANVRLRQAEQRAAVATYERTIQTAFREVADALADRSTLVDRVAATRRNAAAANETLRLVTARYREGIDPYLATLDAQRTAYSAQRSLVQVQFTQARNAVTVYRALGGDGI